MIRFTNIGLPDIIDCCVIMPPYIELVEIVSSSQSLPKIRSLAGPDSTSQGHKGAKESVHDFYDLD